MSKAAISVDIVGERDVRRKLAAVAPIVEHELSGSMDKTAHAGQARARAVVPVLTGALQRAIQARGKGLHWRLGVEGAPQAYALPIEYGTRYVAARHFMH